MCYEDIQLGLRRIFRVQLSPGSVKADARRVVLRLSIRADNAAGTGAAAFLADQSAGGSTPIIGVNPNQPDAELWFERHGLLVTQAFAFSALGAISFTVTEIFDPLLNEPPK